MTLSRGLLTLSLLFLFQAIPALGQPNVDSLGVEARESLVITLGDSVISVAHEFVVHGSEIIFADSMGLRRGLDYLLDYRRGRLLLFPQVWERLTGPLPGPIHLSITYRYLPLDVRESYALREIRVQKDTLEGSEPILVRTEPEWNVDDFLGSGLRKSGSLLRGFTVGSNQELGLNAGFRMQLEGNLAEDVDVVASLTDQNTPIQPEGSTQTLREVDNVFVAITTPVLGATLGDFQVVVDERQGGEFGRFTRKLQGAQGVVQSKEIASSGIGGSLSVTGASPRGKYANNFFQGLEGNQGPYRLTGQNGETLIIVIAGSERVFVNGLPMVRGEVNDYVIDYGSAEITFMSKRLVTSASRITVDFEYSDRKYERTFLSGTAGVKLTNDIFSLNMVFSRGGQQRPADRPRVGSAGAPDLGIERGRSLESLCPWGPVRGHGFNDRTGERAVPASGHHHCRASLSPVCLRARGYVSRVHGGLLEGGSTAE